MATRTLGLPGGRACLKDSRRAFPIERTLRAAPAVLDAGDMRVCTARGAGEATRVTGDLASSAPADADQAYVQATLRGDLRAFEALVERHRDVVVRVAARIAGRDEAEDVSQDAFLRAFHRLGRYRADASFRAWLLQIAHNAAGGRISRPRPEPGRDVADGP